MCSPEAEILAQIRKIQSGLFPALPVELQMAAEDSDAVQIRIHLLRARLEFLPEQEDTPLSLTHLLALLVELIGHLDGLDRSLATLRPEADSPTSNRGSAERSESAQTPLLQSMQAAVLNGELTALRESLRQQRRTIDRYTQPVA